MKLDGHRIWGARPRQNAARTTNGPHQDYPLATTSTRVAVDVTFLRQDAPSHPKAFFPAGYTLARVPVPTVSLYRHLYDTVGAPYLWWLRRTLPDAELAAHLASPGVSLHLLTHGPEQAGFFELDARQGHTVNLSYFGLMPHAIGQGLGSTLLHAALTIAWAHKPQAITVNTCTADHPRALPNYLAAGFVPMRTAREVWDIPTRLGLAIPDHLRA